MLKIAICDDDMAFCLKITKILKSMLRNRDCKIEDFSNGEELLREIESNNDYFDLFILDIDMPKLNGLETGMALRGTSRCMNSMIVYLTGYDSNVSTVVNIHPYAYIKKDFSTDEIGEHLLKCINALPNDERIFFIKNKKEQYPVLLNNIMHLQSINRFTLFYMENGSELLCSLPLSKVYDSLNAKADYFARVYKSDVVNIRYIKSLSNISVTLTNNTTIPLSSKHRNNVLAKFSSRYL